MALDKLVVIAYPGSGQRTPISCLARQEPVAASR